MRVIIRLLLLLCLGAGTPSVSLAAAQQAKPNILVIMGDDIGYWNISAYIREAVDDGLSHTQHRPPRG